jgi:L-malate glycosyltransferase
MKIVHVLYSLDMGGAEVLVRQLCRIQKAEGHDVLIRAYSHLGVVGEAIQADGVDIQVLGKGNPAQTMLRWFKLFRKLKPDVVHFHNTAVTMQAAASARLAGVGRVITTRHRVEPLPYNVPLETKYSLAGFFCDYMTGICEITCVNLRGAPLARKKKIVRVYNGTTAVDRVATEALDKRGFTIVFIGRVVPEKDLGTLIRAVALAVERVPDLQFWIIGDGRVRTELEALTQELGMEGHIRFWGERMDTAQFFSAADVFVMSSVTEGLPMSLLQAMSLGVPAISTDVDGGAEVMRLAESGLLTPVGDAAAFADAIVTMAGDAELRAEFARRGRTAYEQQFTLERMNEGYMELYRSAKA